MRVRKYFVRLRGKWTLVWKFLYKGDMWIECDCMIDLHNPGASHLPGCPMFEEAS